MECLHILPIELSDRRTNTVCRFKTHRRQLKETRPRLCPNARLTDDDDDDDGDDDDDDDDEE